MLTLLNKTGSITVYMLKEATYHGVSLDTLTEDVAKLERAIDWFKKNPLGFELVEMVAETCRTKYRTLFDIQDDGFLPDAVAALIGKVQDYDAMRR